MKWVVLLRQDAGRSARKPQCKTKTKKSQNKYAIKEKAAISRALLRTKRIKHNKGFKEYQVLGEGGNYRRRHQQRPRQQRRRRHGPSSYPLPSTVKMKKSPSFFVFVFFFDFVRVSSVWFMVLKTSELGRERVRAPQEGEKYVELVRKIWAKTANDGRD